MPKIKPLPFAVLPTTFSNRVIYDSSSWGKPERAADCWFTNLSWHIAGFVTIAKFQKAQVAKSSPEIAKYHIRQPFLEGSLI